MKKVIMMEPTGFSREQLEDFQTNLTAKGYELVCFDCAPENIPEAMERAKDAHILITANYPLPEKVLTAAKVLEMVAVAFTGLDHIDTAHCKERNISVANSAGYSTQAVAELTISMMIGLSRNLIPLHEATINAKDRNGFLGSEIKGKTIGILGTGAISQRVMELANAFGAKILVHSMTGRNHLGHLAQYCTLEELLSQSDIISLHLPLTNDTRHLLNETNLSLLKESAFIINTARGPIIDNICLAKLLTQGKIAGAALDVYDTEPPLPKDHPILHAPNTMLLPHIGYATKEAIHTRAQIVMDNVYQYLNAN